MQLERFKIFGINIPFKLEFAHAQAKRGFSDSLILMVEGREGLRGFGEAVIRDYVSGGLINEKGGESLAERAKKVVGKILSPLRDRGTLGGKPEGLMDVDEVIKEVEAYFVGLDARRSELPLVCASELALLDYLCRELGKDIYQLMGRKPVREKLYYGGTLPILPSGVAESILSLFREIEIPNLRIKLNDEITYTEKILSLVRDTLGNDFDIRVDANSSWDMKTALEQMEVLRNFGVSVIEDPLADEKRDFPLLFDNSITSDFVFVSDESMLDFDDIERICEEKYFSIVNIRLSKNGGIFRSLKIAEMAEERGVKYQLGCHVGETGILSAAGRVVASLLGDPLYVDGSYDSYILSDNVTTENLSFGLRGEASIIRGKYLGYTVDIEKLRRLSVETTEYF